MELLQRATIASGRRMQWVCGPEVLGEARAAAAALARSHGLCVDLWRIDDWARLARDGIACERRWLQGRCGEVGSRFERLMAPTRGPILAVTRGLSQFERVGRRRAVRDRVAARSRNRHRMGEALGQLALSCCNPDSCALR